MKLCETLRRGEESWQVVRRKVVESNIVKSLVLLLLRKDDEEPAGTTLPSITSSPDEAAFTNKAIVLDVLYALSNLDTFENETETGDMGERIIKAGGCVISCALINRCATEVQQQQGQSTSSDSINDSRAKTMIEVIRAAVSLLSSMVFASGTSSSHPLLFFKAFKLSSS